MTRVFAPLGTICLGAGIVLFAIDSEDNVIAIVLVGVSVVITMGFAVRRALQVLREMANLRSRSDGEDRGRFRRGP